MKPQSFSRFGNLLVPFALLLLLPDAALGQTAPDSVKRRNDCRLAAQVIETGQPAPHESWAWQQIGACEPSLQVRVLGTAMRQARTTTNVAFAERALLPAVWLRDGALFEQLVQIAGDESASVPARVVAFVALAAIRDPSAAPSYARFIGGVDEHPGGVIVPRARCSAQIAHERGFISGVTAMPPNYVQQIDALRLKVAKDRSEPDDVRSAAACS